MRSLRVTLYTREAITLPIAYNQLVQGVIYSCLRERYPELHDVGYGGVAGFKPFTFSRLEGRSNVKSDSRTIRFFDLVSFEVRSPIEKLMHELADQLARRGSARIGAYELELTNLECRDRLLFPARCLVSLRTPLVVKRTIDGVKTEASPFDEAWSDMLRSNADRKARALGLEHAGSLQAIPLGETMRSQRTHFKDDNVVGWMGDIILGADPDLMAALWCLGLGSRNCEGFGMFDISEKTL